MTPDWAKGAVMYQIFVDRFCNGNGINEVADHEYAYLGKHVERVLRWDDLPKTDDIRRFYGGDLNGVKSKLDYLQNLNERYDDFIYNKYQGRVMTVEKDNLDFVHRPKDLAQIIDRIDATLFGLFSNPSSLTSKP
jgi:hypothetical protein